jgi:hypothetical protein
MKRFHLLLSLVIGIIYATSALSQSDITSSIRNIARAWLLTAPEGTDTITSGQYGLGWREDRFTLQTPAGNWQFYETGSPLQSVVYWPGRMEADVISAATFLGTITGTQVASGSLPNEVARLSTLNPLSAWQDNLLNAGASGISYTPTGPLSAIEPTPGRYFPAIDAIDAVADANYLQGLIRTAGQLRSDLSVAHLVSAPATATSTGTVGQIAYDASFFYVCTATNTWRRCALSTW